MSNILKEGADLNKVANEIVSTLIRHGVMYSEIERVCEHVKEKSFNSVMLQQSFDAAFEEETNALPQETTIDFEMPKIQVIFNDATDLDYEKIAQEVGNQLAKAMQERVVNHGDVL